MLHPDHAEHPRPPLLWRQLGTHARRWSPAMAVFLPFAAGYFLSYWVRTINGPLSDGLIREFGLGPRDLGLLTSLYFLSFAAFQIPAGLLIDRYGPRRVQAILFLAAAVGAIVFATAHGWMQLMVGRTLIGLGCSANLVAGVKALALRLPVERRALGNCCLVMCGGLGAMASAAPAGAAIGPEHWRLVFVVFGIAAIAVSGVIWLVAPEAAPGDTPRATPRMADIALGYIQVVGDRRFWRVAPLSAGVVGSAFAVHGLWAARWLEEVAGAAPSAIATALLTMGASLTVGAVLFGVLATRLRSRGVTTTRFFGWSALAFIGTELMLALGGPVPPVVSLAAFAVFGAITVLSFTIIGELFPTEMVGRGNAALNVLHLGAAFVIQAGIGAILSLWPSSQHGHAPAAAYATAFAVLAAMQAVALVWFTTEPAFRARLLLIVGGRFGLPNPLS